MTAPAAPLVSVCIPTYKGAATLGPAIASVLGQTLHDLELVVLDDNSPDHTAEVVASFDDPRLRCIRHPANLGPQGNWNRCLTEARGRYFKLLPHDDLLAPDCLARQVAVLEQDAGEQIALVFSARDVLTADGRKVARRGHPAGRDCRLAADALRRQCVRMGTNLIGEPGAVLLRRSLAQRVGLFDASQPYVIDMDYWFRLLAHGDAHYLDAALASFRVSGAQWSVVLGGRQDSDFRQCVQRHDAGGALQLGWLDRALGSVTPTLNKFARLAFYRLYL